MSILGIDLGGSKIATALFSESGTLLTKESVSLGRRKGSEVGALIGEQVKKYQSFIADQVYWRFGAGNQSP